MRTMSPAAAAILAQAQGLEPVNLVRVFWTNTTSITYGDRKFASDGIVGRLLEISNLEDVVNITKSSNTSAITVKLDDSDSYIKSVFDSVDIIKRTVYVYQWFTELPLADAFVVFEGEISSPINWKEGERTITFDVLSKIEDIQYGFSADEGDFNYIPQGIIGVAWPLPFGTVDLVPALQLYNLPKGLLQTSTTGKKSSNPTRQNNLLESYYKAFNAYNECITKELFCLSQSEELQFDLCSQGYSISLPKLQAPAEGTGAIQAIVQGFATDQWSIKAGNYAVQAEGYRQQYMNIEREMNSINSSNANKDTKLTVQNGAQFPQGVPTSIVIGGNTYTGEFSGNLFTVLSTSSPFETDGTLLAGPLTVSDSDAATEYAAQLNEQNFFFNVAGSAAIASGALSYIVSLFEVQVAGVYAVYNGLLTAVPSNLYTISYVNFGALQATYLTCPKALSLVDKSWGDNLYCTVTSPVGPNVVDILEWLILNYTNHTYDATTFATVRNQVAQYPANFVLTKQGNIVKLLQQIAFQARCALWYKQGKFYIKFLADMSTFVDTLDEDDVEFGTMDISCTPTEELVTKYTATYSAGASFIDLTINPVTQLLSPPGNDKVIWYFNMQKYGLLEKGDEYFIYKDPQLVIRASMFWLVRYTNTWKRIKFSTFLSHLDLETFDYVLLNFNRPWIANAPVVGMVESCLYDSGNNRVELTIWVPVRFGEMTQYPFAAPYAISPTLVFPEEFEQANSTGTSEVNKSAKGSLIPANTTNVPPGQNPLIPPNNITPSDTGFAAADAQFFLDPALFDNSTNPTANTAKQFSIKPVFDPPNADLPGVFPGIVRGLSNGNIYNVDVYFNGLQGDSTSVKVEQLRINADDTIDDGTPAMVTRCLIKKSTDNVLGVPKYSSEYTMQVPVFLKSVGSQDSGADVPNSDGGSPTPAPSDVPAPSPGNDGNSEGSGDENLG